MIDISVQISIIIYQTGEKMNKEFPQGLVLGVLLVLYIHDIIDTLEMCLENSDLNLFANDTLLITISSSNINYAITKLNSDLNRLSNQLQINKLKSNLSKTKYMTIGKQSVINIK